MPRSPAAAKPSSRLSVFDFSKADEMPEKASKVFTRRFRDRRRSKRETSPVTKYNFLECFTGRKQSVADDKDNKAAPQNCNSFDPIDVDDDPVRTCSSVVEGVNALSMDISAGAIDIDAGDLRYHQGSRTGCAPQRDHVIEDTATFVETTLLSSDSDNEKNEVDMALDDDKQIEIQWPVASISTSAEKKDLSDMQEVELGSVGHIIDSSNSSVVVFPGYVIYGDVYSTCSCLTFSSRYIRLEASNINGTTGTLKAEWPVNDIVSFESQWCQRVEIAFVELRFRSNTSTVSGNGDPTSGTESLKFTACDSHWSEGLEAIKSLDVQYAHVWSSASGEVNEEGSFGRSCWYTSQSSCSRLGDDGNPKQVVYPIDDPDAVLVSIRDLELLRPETFINDTVIDFYVKYLINHKIRQEDQTRFHFFNCFFFRKLADLDNLGSVGEGKAAFQRVHKWTKKLNLFDKDYLFIPVNYSLHWSLIVICHPGEVALSEDDMREKSAKIPCILHMDSIQGSHRGLKNLFQSYLVEEWKARNRDMVDDVSLKFLDLSFIPLELPQQGNSYDCGLFLLHYLELFVENAPVNFSPSILSESSNFLNKTWFLPDEASLKRRHIQKLISQVLLRSPEGNQSVDSIHKRLSPQKCEDAVVKILEEPSISPKKCLTDTLRLNIVKSLIATSPSRGSFDKIGEPGIAFRELSEPGTSSRLLCDEIYQRKPTPFSVNLSPVEEAEECVSATEDCFSETEDCVLATEDSFSETEDCMLVTGNSPGAPRKQKDEHVEELPDKCGSQKSSETCKLEFSSTSSQELDAYVIQDSEDESSMLDGQVVEDSVSSIHGDGNGAVPSNHQFDSTENTGEEVSSKARMEVDVLESDVKVAYKFGIIQIADE